MPKETSHFYYCFRKNILHSKTALEIEDYFLKTKGSTQEVLSVLTLFNNIGLEDFSGGTVDKNLPAIAGDMGLIPGLGRSHMPWSSLAHISTPPKSLPCALQREATARRNLCTTTKSSPHAPKTEECLLRQTVKTQYSRK